MSDEFKHIVVDGLSLSFCKSDILFPTYNGIDLEQFLLNEAKQTKFDFKPERKEDTVVGLSDEIEKLITVLCKTVKNLKASGENESAAYFASYFFRGLTIYSEELKNRGLYSHACNYWLTILSLVYTNETKIKVEIHKGHPYFFLAFYFLLSGDLETGFIYAYNALNEDKKIGKLCPNIGYPKEAPIYLTIFLVDNPRNRMIDLVKDLRLDLRKHIASYNKEFGKNFSLKDFDMKFLQNDSNLKLEGPRCLFTFTFWSLIDLNKKTDLKIKNNDFSKLRNLNWIFNLCLILDKILEANPKIGGDSMAKNTEKVFDYLNLFPWNKLRDIEKKYNLDINRSDPDKALDLLLSMNLAVNSFNVPKLGIHYLIAWNLRNYGGHNIKQQNYLVKHFNEIFNILMKCIISSIDLL